MKIFFSLCDVFVLIHAPKVIRRLSLKDKTSCLAIAQIAEEQDQKSDFKLKNIFLASSSNNNKISYQSFLVAFLSK